MSNDMPKCKTCDDTGLVDSGGQNPDGTWINRECPDCAERDPVAEIHKPSERCPRWSCYKEAYYLGGRPISCTDCECANYDKDFMRAVESIREVAP